MFAFRILFLVCCLCAPAMAEEVTATPVSSTTDDVRLDHSDWSAGFDHADIDSTDDAAPRLQIEKNGFDDDSGDYQSPAE